MCETVSYDEICQIYGELVLYKISDDYFLISQNTKKTAKKVGIKLFRIHDFMRKKLFLKINTFCRFFFKILTGPLYIFEVSLKK